jgi:hypothetical protein
MSLLTDIRLDIADDIAAIVVAPGVSGPIGGATDNGVARFDGITGTTIQGSLATLDDVGNLSTPGDIIAGTALRTAGALYLTPTFVTAPGPVSVSALDSIIMLNKTIGGATTLTLSSSQVSGRVLIIKDLKGDANLNNITVLASGGETIDGLLGILISQNYQSITLIYNGSGWSLI